MGRGSLTCMVSRPPPAALAEWAWRTCYKWACSIRPPVSSKEGDQQPRGAPPSKAHAGWTAALVAACALAAAAAYLLTDRHPPAGPSLQDELHRSGQLDGKLAATRQAVAAKQAITAEVIAGRRTLFEAAAAFQALNGQNPDFNWAMFCRHYPGGSDGERYCRYVLRWVELHLPEGSGQAEQVLKRLEAELEAHLRQHGTVVLPPE